jgi:hypothetical protein
MPTPIIDAIKVSIGKLIENNFDSFVKLIIKLVMNQKEDTLAASDEATGELVSLCHLAGEGVEELAD